MSAGLEMDQERAREFNEMLQNILKQTGAILEAQEAAELVKLEEKRQELKPKTVVMNVKGCEVKMVTNADASVTWTVKDFELESPLVAKGVVKLAKSVEVEKEAEKLARKALKRYLGE